MASERRRILGRIGEAVALAYLRSRGWSLRERGVRLAGVEVDLVVRRGALDALVEVKWRSRRLGSEDRLEAFVSGKQRDRLQRAAREWAARECSSGPSRTVRVDLVVLRPFGRWPPVLHVRDLGRQEPHETRTTSSRLTRVGS